MASSVQITELQINALCLCCICACLFNLILLLDGMDRMEELYTLCYVYLDLDLDKGVVWYPSFGFLEGESGPSKQLLQIDSKSMRLIPTTGQETSTLVK